MQEKKVFVPNINCGHCVATISRELEEVEGVVSADGDPDTKEVTIRWEAPATWETIKRTLAEIGYPV
jgi:copper chaperone